MDQAAHPLVTTDRYVSATPRRFDFACISLELDVQEFSRARGLTGRLRADNACDFDVALLLSPVETRVREPQGKPLLNERMRHAAYARLYLISSQTELPDAFSEADGGLMVYGLPDYTVIPAKSKKEIAVHGSNGTLSQIQDGKYFVFVESIIAALNERDCKSVASSMDLGKQVSKRSDTEARVLIRPQAEWVTSSGPIVAVTD